MKNNIAVIAILIITLYACDQTVPNLVDENESPSVFLNEVGSSLPYSEEFTFIATASDPDGDRLSYSWFVDDSLQSGEVTDSFIFSATPSVATTYNIKVTVSDGTAEASDVTTCTVGSLSNSPPYVSINEHAQSLGFEQELTFTTTAGDSDGDSLAFSWSVDGVVQPGEEDSSFTFSAAPSVVTTYNIKVTVSDGTAEASDVTTCTVGTYRNFPPYVRINEHAQRLGVDEEFTFTTTAGDSDGDSLAFSWSVDGVVQPGEEDSSFTFSAAPSSNTHYEIAVQVTDGVAYDSESVECTVGVIETDTNLYGMTFVTVVAPGERTRFTAGINRAVLTRAYAMGTTEVTQGQYQTVMNVSMGWTDTFGAGANFPAYNITWYDAAAFCNTLSSSEGRTPAYDPSDWSCDFTSDGYRLPTEAEWQYAARGGALSKDYNRKYSGSDDPSEVAWYTANSGGTAQRVAQLKGNELGIFDMSGNLLELCNDWYDGTYPYSGTNPEGPSTGTQRLILGGNYGNYDPSLNIRGAATPSGTNRYFGFRVLRPLD